MRKQASLDTLDEVRAPGSDLQTLPSLPQRVPEVEPRRRLVEVCLEPAL